jgi:DNA-binding response OmpR family regulator
LCTGEIVEKPQKILVVDDDMLVCWSLEKGLLKEGFMVSVARSGEEAVEVLQKDGFDLVITDLKMPGIDGITVIDKAREQNSHPRSILITAYGSETVVDAAARRGASYVGKPFQVEDVVAKVHEILVNR